MAEKLTFQYDRDADILYINTVPPYPEQESEELGDEIIAQLNPKTGKIENFYSADGSEPPHVHVGRERNKAKFWLDPVRLQNSGGYSRNEINRIQRLIEENQEMLLEKWNDYFSD